MFCLAVFGILIPPRRQRCWPDQVLFTWRIPVYLRERKRTNRDRRSFSLTIDDDGNDRGMYFFFLCLSGGNLARNEERVKPQTSLFCSSVRWWVVYGRCVVLCLAYEKSWKCVCPTFGRRVLCLFSIQTYRHSVNKSASARARTLVRICFGLRTQWLS